MPLVSLTRLHIRAFRHLPMFALSALLSAQEAKAAPGNIAVALLAEARRTFWTRTVWSDEAALGAFMRMNAHRGAMGKLSQWCDEAAVARWTQPTAEPPSWDEAWQRMQRDGRTSSIRRPAPAHANFQIAPPQIGRFSELRLK